MANLHYVGESVTGLPWLFHGAFLDVGLAFNNKTELFSGKIADPSWNFYPSDIVTGYMMCT